MPTIEFDLQTYLQDNLSNNVKCYPMRLPQGITLPATMYRRISGQRIRSVEGPSGLSRPRIEINAYSQSYTEAKELAAEIRQLLDGFRGMMGAGSMVENIIIDNDQDALDDDTGFFRIIIDAIVWHQEN